MLLYSISLAVRESSSSHIGQILIVTDAREVLPHVLITQMQLIQDLIKKTDRVDNKFIEMMQSRERTSNNTAVKVQNKPTKNQDFQRKKNEEKANKKKEDELKAQQKEKEQMIKASEIDYKDPQQLSEGEIMIVIEHSDDPGRVLMSTSHDYEKYKRIASKIRSWIIRDFPSMKVVIKPNNHQKDNKRIGCFEISYFHMKKGVPERQNIFSKMVERQWPKWVNVQEKIKKYVKNSNLTVTIVDISPERKNQFAGMTVHVKNVLFAKNSGGGSLNNSLNGSSMMASNMGVEEESTLTDFKSFTSTGEDQIEFQHLPVGNYAIVFNGNRTYNPVNIVDSINPAFPSQR